MFTELLKVIRTRNTNTCNSINLLTNFEFKIILQNAALIKNLH